MAAVACDQHVLFSGTQFQVFPALTRARGPPAWHTGVAGSYEEAGGQTHKGATHNLCWHSDAGQPVMQDKLQAHTGTGGQRQLLI